MKVSFVQLSRERPPFPFEIFDGLFDAEINKDPDFHFGYSGWEDVRSAVMLHAYNKFDKFDPSRPVQPWLKTVICNQILNKKRNYAHRNQIEQKVCTRYEQFHEFIADLNNSPSEVKRASFDLFKQALKEVWAALSLRHKKILVLRFRDNLSTFTIGERFHLTSRMVYRIIQFFKINCARACKTHGLHIRNA